MSGLVDAVHRKVSNESFARKCDRDGCSLSLKDAPRQHLLVDFDKLDLPSGNEARRCDYLFVSDSDSDNRPYIAPIELKKGQMHTGQVAAQIQAGARIAEKFFPAKTAFSFRPVAACGGKATKIQIRRLREEGNKINFHGHRESIRLIRCGSPLIKALRM